ncbi:hypothetical protein AMK59_4679, partial [Oryctes borbonicus]
SKTQPNSLEQISDSKSVVKNTKMASTTINRVICWIMFGLIVATAINCSALNKKFLSYTEMVQRTQTIGCKPRLRSFRIKELFTDVSENAVAPSRIVLYRCGDSLGCCETGEVCTVKDSMPLTIQLVSTQGSDAYIIRHAEDHLSCKCVPANEDTIK